MVGYSVVLGLEMKVGRFPRPSEFSPLQQGSLGCAVSLNPCVANKATDVRAAKESILAGIDAASRNIDLGAGIVSANIEITCNYLSLDQQLDCCSEGEALSFVVSFGSSYC
jgi:hypothetical protein